ncbi:MAG: hypothetical protein K8R23_04405 [Chthoniobacter sp.]|nr:hypothetical protein [Chthoniobacter sp.]
MKTLRFLLLTCVLALFGVPAFAQTTVTITAPDASAAEVLPGQAADAGTMRIARTGSTASALTVWVKVSGVAVQGEDYTFGGSIGASVVIPAGSSTLDIPVTVLDDWLTEGTEDVRIKLDTKTATGANVPYTVGAADRASVNIADNEDPLAAPRAIVTVAAVDGVATETAAGTDPAVFRITRTNNLAPALTVRYALGGTAVSGTDFAALPATITLPAGVPFVDVVIAPIDDLLVEDPVSLTFTLLPTDVVGTPSPAEAYVLGPAITASATIVSEDLPPAPTVAITSPGANASVTQGDSLTVNFTAAAADGYVTSYTVFVGGVAVASDSTGLPANTPAGTPFAGTVSATLTSPGAAQALTVQVTNDHGTSNTSAAVPVTVVPLPPPTVAITSPGNYAVAAATQPIAVNFTAAAVDGYIVSYTVYADGTAYSGTTGLPASTPAGTPFSGTANVIFTNPSTSNYYTRPLTVRVTNNHGISSTSAYVGIMVAPDLPFINIYPLDAEGAEVSAGAPNVASFRVTHSQPASATVGFLFAVGGTAREGIDYTLTPTSGTITNGIWRWFSFAPGTTEAIIQVNPIDDLLIENAETVSMSLYTPPFIGFNEGPVGPFDWNFGFLYGPSSSALVSILDNDTTPPPFPVVTIAATDPTGRETADGSDPAVFTVTRTSGPTDVPLTVNYAFTIPPKQTIYVTEPRPAMAKNGVDFPLLSGSVTIPAGATSADIVVVPTYDLLTEVSELLQITLAPSVPASPAAGSYVIDDHHMVAEVNILDALLPPGIPTVSVRVTDALAFREDLPGRTASFAIERTGSVTDPLVVSYTIGGTATNGVDYATIPSSVTIPAGSSSATIVIDPFVTVGAITETVSLTLNAPALVAGLPPFLIGSTLAMPPAGGISIIDRPYFLNTTTPAKLRALLRRRHHLVLPIPLPPTPPALVADAKLGAAAASPTIWTVEASTDLANWEEIGTTDPSGEVGDFVDVNAGDFTTRFYRFVQPAVPAP